MIVTLLHTRMDHSTSVFFGVCLGLRGQKLGIDIFRMQDKFLYCFSRPLYVLQFHLRVIFLFVNPICSICSTDRTLSQ